MSVNDADMSRHGMPEPDRYAAVIDGAGGPVKATTDWLFCIKRRGSVVTKLMFVMVGIPLIALIYFVISTALSAPHSSQVVV